MKTSKDAEALSPDADAILSRVRRILYAFAVVWLLHLGVSLALDSYVEGGPPMWLARGGLVFAMVFELAGALSLKPGSKAGWGTAVSAAGLTMLHPLLFIPAFYVVWQLFKRPVMAACLGGPWRE